MDVAKEEKKKKPYGVTCENFTHRTAVNIFEVLAALYAEENGLEVKLNIEKKNIA